MIDDVRQDSGPAGNAWIFGAIVLAAIIALVLFESRSGGDGACAGQPVSIDVSVQDTWYMDSNRRCFVWIDGVGWSPA
jgi:hypothetical protein